MIKLTFDWSSQFRLPPLDPRVNDVYLWHRPMIAGGEGGLREMTIEEFVGLEYDARTGFLHKKADL